LDLEDRFHGVIVGDVNYDPNWGWGKHGTNVWQKGVQGQPSRGGVWGGG
jgi:hypothetical protein